MPPVLVNNLQPKETTETKLDATRRDFLKKSGLGMGALALAPVLNQLKARAAGIAPKAPRFVFVVESNGIPPQQMVPLGIERKPRPQQPLNGPAEFVDVSLKDRELPYSLQPVSQWKDKLTIVQGLSGKVASGGHSNNYQALGAFGVGRGDNGESTAILSPTIDGALAKHLGGIFPHVGLGISERLENSVIYSISAIGENKPLPLIVKPDQAMGTLFGSVADGQAKNEFLATRNLLDFLKDDIKRAEKKLAGPEREQLSVYLSTFDMLSDRHSRLNEIEPTLRKHAPVTSDKYTPDVETDRLDAQFDLAAAALISGLTNVVTLSSAAGIRNFDICFTGLGLKKGKHHTGHGGSQHGMTWAETYDMIRKFHFDLIARLAKKLDAIPEGDGTMLDNSVIVFISDG
ncbi:MAG: DUF1552 domain-containing protein, partial [Planctomycetaceae bacterium]|nr:DUF1552 domain-containing protein [Planctomycetaceae bacterium]